MSRPSVLVAGALTTAIGMIVTPLAPRGGPVRRSLSGVVIAGLATTTAAATVRRWGAARTGVAGAVIGGIAHTVERCGSRHGLPFGRYRYTDALRPQVGGVPIVVPAAWFAMAVPSREVAHAALGDRSTAARRVVLGAAALTAWDLFLDPQMVGEGYWAWAKVGRYRGIPASNFIGWFVTSLGLIALLEVMLPVDTAEPVQPDPVLVGEYAFIAVMETLGFARFFRDRTVALVGGAAMLPVAIAALARLMSAPGAGRASADRGR